VIELRGPTIDGTAAAVRLRARPGPAEISAAGARCPIAEARVVATFRTTTVELAPGVRLGTVEHLFAALAGLGVRDGISVEVEGGAVPLLDGGAAALTDAARALSLSPAPPRWRVVRDAAIDEGGARATFTRGGGVAVRVRVVGLGALDGEVAWCGDPEDFRARIAPARTFLVADDADAMLAAGLRADVDARSVVVVDRAGGAFGVGGVARDEPARHKLLDLIGDLYAWGGPFEGEVLVERPGHSVNHALVERARSEGILAPS